DTKEPAGPRLRQTVPVGDLLQERGAEADCGSLHSPTGAGQSLRPSDRDGGHRASSLLSGRGISSGLRETESPSSLCDGECPSETGQAQEAISPTVQEVEMDQRVRPKCGTASRS